MKEAKEIASATVGPVDNFEAAKIVAAVVTVSDLNLKMAKEICAVVCEMRDDGFVCVACC